MIGSTPVAWTQNKLPMKIGDVNVVQGQAIQRSGVVLGDDDTAYLLSMLSNGENHLMRISRRGAVAKLVLFRGWPYILDKHGRIYSLDISWKTVFRSKLPYITMRSLKTLPIALGIGGAIYGIALLDQTMTGIIATDNFHASDAFWGSVITFYGLDIGYTTFVRTQRDSGDGGNFFKEVIAKGVTEFTEDPRLADYRIVAKQAPVQTQVRYLSKLAPNYSGTSSCIEYLTKMNMKR